MPRTWDIAVRGLGLLPRFIFAAFSLSPCFSLPLPLLLPSLPPHFCKISCGRMHLKAEPALPELTAASNLPSTQGLCTCPAF